MLRLLPFCNGFRFLLLLLIPTVTNRVFLFLNSMALDGELLRVNQGARVEHKLISLSLSLSVFQSENGSRVVVSRAFVFLFFLDING
jgi:hypothetical protein